MKVLVACEESQRVCMEFRKLGHEAYSCDIESCSGGHQEWHIQADVLPLLNGNCSFKTVDGIDHRIDGKWNIIIAFPPCTYLTVTGNSWFNIERYGDKAVQRYKDREKAIKFFMQFVNADCEKIAIENPVGIMSTEYRKPDQIIQPYMFGDAFEKRTCLWLKNLNQIEPTNIVKPPPRYVLSSGNTMPEWYAKLGKNRQKIRSKTFPGVARAMAEQWGNEGVLEMIDNTESYDVYSADTVKELTKRVKAIHSALSVVEKNFIKISFDLYWIYTSKAYKSMGCESITDFAQKEFGLSKTTTYDYLNLVERFGERDKEGKLLEGKIDPVYKDYSTSKLSAISGLSDKEIKSLDITPDMSTRDIKKAVKKHEDVVALQVYLDTLTKNKIESSKGSPDNSSLEETEDPQQELQIGDDNTVAPPPDVPDQDKPEDDKQGLKVYCSVNEQDFTSWQKDEKTKDKFVVSVFENIFKRNPGAVIFIEYYAPPKKKGGKRK